MVTNPNSPTFLNRPVIAAKSRKDRREKEVILLEGQRLICDAIDAGVKIKSLYFSKVKTHWHLALAFAMISFDVYRYLTPLGVNSTIKSNGSQKHRKRKRYV